MSYKTKTRGKVDGGGTETVRKIAGKGTEILFEII